MRRKWTPNYAMLRNNYAIRSLRYVLKISYRDTADPTATTSRTPRRASSGSQVVACVAAAAASTEYGERRAGARNTNSPGVRRGRW